MATPSKNQDRRAERTRQLLHQAFLDVVREKGLSKASVQDIVDRANVSRGTFYAHYADKYALIEAIMREGIRHNLSTLPTDSNWNRQVLRQLVKIVLDYFKSIYQQHHRSRDIGPVIDQAIRDEVTVILLRWMKQTPRVKLSLPIEMTAHIITWTIFGAALQWISDANHLSVDEMAQEIVTMLMDGLALQLPEN